MLRLRARFTDMHLLLVFVFMVRVAAQPSCDPQTQYEREGQCCTMCAPGTSMSTIGTCLEPQCNVCGDNEYQDKYTTADKCQRQPYCDPNKNFQVAAHVKNKRTICLCKLGFHCSSEECITCVPHSTCQPGHGAKSTGNHTHDTVCQKCPKGTFSNETSWDGVCQKWTQCGTGYHIKQNGTDVSDNICEKTSRTHVVVLCVMLPLIFLVLIVGLVLWRCKGKQGDPQGRVKTCVESCLDGEKEPLREDNIIITTPTDHGEEESMLPEMQSSQEEGFARTPEENEDQHSQEMSGDVLLTDKGNYVTQENGKTEVLSRQESQTQTFTD